MMASQHLRYIGPPDLHDATVVSVQQDSDTLVVQCTSESARPIVLEFVGVSSVESVRPEGMLLYALAEHANEPPLRRFVFLNWHEDDDATLRIIARDFREMPTGKKPELP